jgi:parvulin-like peptidyl-prolyl isomerase
MKFHTRLLCLLLAGALALSLAACSGKNAGEDADSADQTGGAESLLPDDFVVDTSVEDLCLATADIPGDFVLLTVNGEPVTARSYLYRLGYNIYYLISTYGSSVIDWTTTDSGFNLADYLKEETQNAAAYYALIESKAKELGFELTQEQTDELDSTLLMSIWMAGGEEAYNDQLRKVGLDYDTFYQISAASYYYSQLMDGLFGDRPTDQEIADYIQENDILSAKHILLLTVDPTTGEALDDDVIAEKKATAESLLSQLQSSTDLAADFDALMNEYSEDSGLANNPDGYTFTAGQMVEAFENATRELEYGQLSDIVESPYGYHIILRQDPNTEDTRKQYRADLLEDQLQSWLDEADIVCTDEYEALNIQLFYEKFTAYQEAFAAEEEAAEEAADSADAADDQTSAADGAGETTGEP